MSDPHEAGSGIGVTIKYGKGYDESWLTFRGSVERVREDIIAVFGMDGASVRDLNLNAVVTEATSIAHGLSAANSGFGGTIISTSGPSASDTPSVAQEQGSADDVWAQAAATPEEPKVNPLITAIEGASDTESLRVLYAENQSAFTSDAALFEQWKAKGKALSAAVAA